MPCHMAKPKPTKHRRVVGTRGTWALAPAFHQTLGTGPHLTLLETWACLSLCRFLVCFGLVEKGLFKQRLEGSGRRSCCRAARKSEAGRAKERQGPEQKHISIFGSSKRSAWLEQEPGGGGSGGRGAGRLSHNGRQGCSGP